MPEVRLSGLSKQFAPHIRALTDVNLAVADGERLVVLGPSGCGKTTLLRVLAGLERPDRGSVWIDQRDVTRQTPASRELSMVFQGENQFPHLNVRDNLALALRLRRVPRQTIEERIRETSELLGLKPLLSRWPQELSGGERQRVALGRALVSRAPLCLLDEPLSNVDPSLRSDLRQVIRTLHQQTRATLLYVTHDQMEAMSIADRLAVMHDGSICQIGSAAEVYAWPATTFVAEFIGSPPMNLFSGQLLGGRLECWGQVIPTDLDTPSGPVTVGIRPERLGMAAAGTVRLCGTIETVEFFGHDKLIRLTNASQTLSARRPIDYAGNPHDTIELTCEPSDVYLFAADSTGRLLGKLSGESPPGTTEVTRRGEIGGDDPPL